jgi:RNA polymerase sigma factor (sigma-70 family)
VVAATDNFAQVYEQAMARDEDAQAALWSKYRSHMHRVIRCKASDLGLERAVDPDDIYDAFFYRLFSRRPGIPFESESHFARYLEKSLRRSTIRTLQAGRRRVEVSLDAFDEFASNESVLDELIWEESLAAARAALSDRETTICSLFQAGHTWVEVSQQLELPGDSARKIHQRAMSRISIRFCAGP